MNAENKKLPQVDGLTSGEVITRRNKQKSEIRIINETDITLVKPGMIWYEDDTFSFDRIPTKKIKAIVELVKDGIIYGNMAASDLCSIPTKNLMSWYDAGKYLDNCSYPCKTNEKIVWYNIAQLKEVYKKRKAVRKTFNMLGKIYYDGDYWSSLVALDIVHFGVNFKNGVEFSTAQDVQKHVAVVLALNVI